LMEEKIDYEGNIKLRSEYQKNENLESKINISKICRWKIK